MFNSPDNFELIIGFEVTSETYYKQNYSKPVVPHDKEGKPTESSGVTIGIGYDLGQEFVEMFRKDWNGYLNNGDLSALSNVCGLKGYSAKAALRSVQNVNIPYVVAYDQFVNVTLPRFWDVTEAVFKGINEAPNCVKEAVLSLVYNRGGSMIGNKRLEMRNIAALIATKDYGYIADQFRFMKRLWPNSKGLRDRRDKEANFIEEGLKS